MPVRRRGLYGVYIPVEELYLGRRNKRVTKPCFVNDATGTVFAV